MGMSMSSISVRFPLYLKTRNTCKQSLERFQEKFQEKYWGKIWKFKCEQTGVPKAALN